MPQVHGDNPTIITSEIAWLALTAMIMLTVFARRKSYELFYYCHVVIGLGFLAAALIHVRHCLSLVPSTAFPVCLPLPFPCVFHGLSRASTAAFSVCLSLHFPCVFHYLGCSDHAFALWSRRPGRSGTTVWLGSGSGASTRCCGRFTLPAPAAAAPPRRSTTE